MQLQRQMRCSRRSFLAGCVSAGMVGYGARADRPLARLGVLSDVHLNDPGRSGYFRKALEFYRDAGVDGVVIAGDIASVHGV